MLKYFFHSFLFYCFRVAFQKDNPVLKRAIKKEHTFPKALFDSCPSLVKEIVLLCLHLLEKRIG